MDIPPTIPAIQTNKLQLGYSKNKSQQALGKPISIAIPQGKLIALLGANGIGKSTFIRTLSGLHPSLSGTLQLFNKPIKLYKPVELSTYLSVVLTDPIANANLSVFELVALGRYPYTNWLGQLAPIDQKKIKDAMEFSKITSLSSRRCHELSDGQLQNVLIARAIAQDTPLIILDEPTTHLDIYYKTHVIQLLKRLVKEQHKTILFSTHEINLALESCDEAIVMNENTSAMGTPEKLIQQGVFENLFPDGLLTFDVKNKQYKMKNEY